MRLIKFVQLSLHRIFLKKAAKGLDIPVTGRCMVVVDKVIERSAKP